MRTFLLAAICLGFSAQSQAAFPSINHIVLGVNLDTSLEQFSFPCIAGPSDVVFCHDNIAIEDTACANSLSYKKEKLDSISISCHLSDGRNVELAQSVGPLSVDYTQDAFGYLVLKMNPAVSLKAVKNRRGMDYLLLVK